MLFGNAGEPSGFLHLLGAVALGLDMNRGDDVVQGRVGRVLTVDDQADVRGRRQRRVGRRRLRWGDRFGPRWFMAGGPVVAAAGLLLLVRLDENTASSLCYTSGTTGNPKGALYSHRSTVLHSYAACMMDTLGKWIKKPFFNELGKLSEGLAAAKKERKWGFVDKTGEWVIEPQFFNAEHFSEGLAPVCQGRCIPALPPAGLP